MILFYSNLNKYGPLKLRPLAAAVNNAGWTEATDFIHYKDVYTLIDLTWTSRYSSTTKYSVINYRGVRMDQYQYLLSPRMIYTLYGLLIASRKRKPKELV